MRFGTNKMVKMAVLAAMSVTLLLLFRFPLIPAAPFLIYEPADVPILIGTFMYGPGCGFIITVVVALLQSLTVNASDGWVGFVMHVIATGTLVLVAGSIYRKVHTFKGAVIGLIAGSLSMTAMMIPNNLFFDVKFYGMQYEAVRKMIVPAILPFNLFKSLINSTIVLLVYKPISRLLKRERNLEQA